MQAPYRVCEFDYWDTVDKKCIRRRGLFHGFYTSSFKAEAGAPSEPYLVAMVEIETGEVIEAGINIKFVDGVAKEVINQRGLQTLEEHDQRKGGLVLTPGQYTGELRMTDEEKKK